MAQEQPLHEAINDLWKDGLRDKRRKTDMVRRSSPAAVDQDNPNRDAPAQQETLLEQARALVLRMSPEERAQHIAECQQRQAEALSQTPAEG